METNIIEGTQGAKHLVGSPVTVAVTDSEVPELLLDDIDQRLVKVRPMATPVDQISRHAGAKACKSMIVDFYSVDSLPAEAVVTEDADPSLSSDVGTAYVDRPGVFSPSDTLMAIEPNAAVGSQAPVFYVEEAGARLSLKVIGQSQFPGLPEGTRLVRMGRAAAELDVQTPQAQVLPKKSNNYCQIFKAQVEQSVLHRLAAKEVGITLSDQEEVALMDMRLGIEKSYLFGSKARFDKGLAHGEVFLTQGIWSQAGSQFSYSSSRFTNDMLIDMSRRAFTGNAGSSRKVLIGGSGLIEALSKISVDKQVGAMQTTTRWGIDFREIHTNFGTLYVVMSEVFDLCGHADDGIVIDPEYIQKYVHIPFRATPIDLRASGQRNCDAIVLTEASCLVLRYPTAHMRIVRTHAGVGSTVGEDAATQS